MIVLGPHIHHHNDHHVLENNGGDAAEPDSNSSANRQYNAFRSSSNSGGGIADEDTGKTHQQSLSDTTGTRSPLEVRCNNIMLLQARVEISKLLGSIGAPPLISSVTGATTEEVVNINTTPNTREESVQTYLDNIVELATSHTELLKTMQSCLHMLTIGTGVRLGIGPNNIPGSRRAERAWLERKLRQHDTAEAVIMESYRPRLTLHRCRQIVHHAIVDQTSSLHSIACGQRVNFEGVTDWDDFVHDLKHTIESNCVLTLSQLTKWVDSVGQFLRALLSEFLFEETQSKSRTATITIANSVQMARERNVFLQSAFSMSSSSTTTSCEDNLKRATGNKDGIDMNNLIGALKSNLEGAHVSLWAFEESRTRSEECSESERKKWLVELRDLVERLYSTMSELDKLLLPRSSDEESKDKTDESPSDNTIDEHCTAPPSAILVSDGAGVDDEARYSVNGTKKTVPLDKTLIFSGNGSHKRSQISKDKPARRPVKSQNMSRPPSFFNETVLLRDLQSRLKTMGLAEEYEVVAATERHQSTPVGRSKSQSRQGTDLPMFLGVSGPALAELSSAMGRQLEGQVIIE